MNPFSNRPTVSLFRTAGALICLFLAIGTVASALAAEGPASEKVSPADREAINKAVLHWVRLLDKGDYSATFSTASEGFRKNLTVEKWQASHTSMQKEFGELISRSGRVALRTRTSTTDATKPEVAYVMDIETKFSKTGATEHITFVKESGEWKVSDYSIEVKNR